MLVLTQAAAVYCMFVTEVSICSAHTCPIASAGPTYAMWNICLGLRNIGLPAT